MGRWQFRCVFTSARLFRGVFLASGDLSVQKSRYDVGEGACLPFVLIAEVGENLLLRHDPPTDECFTYASASRDISISSMTMSFRPEIMFR